MIYEIYTESGTKKKRALTGNGYGLPLGTWISYEGTCPDGFIEAGQSYNTSVYSALYAMLGSNTVPERFDHDRPSEWEEVVSTNTFTPNYDGVMIVGVNNTNLIVKVNDVEITRVETGQITDTSIPFKKGDVVTFFNLGGSAISKSFKVSYYKKHLAIKATPAYVEPDTVSDMVNTLRTQDSYSTEEVNTGKKWIDGKMIYRRVINIDNPPNNWSTIDLSSLFPNIAKGFLGKMCRITRQGGTVVCQSSFYYNDSDMAQLVLAENTNNTRICCFLKSPYPITNIQFEVNYTKTTD